MSLGHGSSIIRDGLVLHLDAANPKSYPGSGTTWNDLSGNGYDGTLVNGVGYSADNNGYFTFEGSTQTIALSTYPQVYAGSVTFSGWYYFTTSNTRDVLYSNYTATPTVSFERHTSDRLRMYWNNGVNDIYTPDNVVPAETWHFICMIRNKETSQFQFYVNGQMVHNPNVSAADLSSVNGPYRIGRDTRTDFTALGGYCAGVCIYNRTLSALEIQQNFEALRGRYGI